MASSSEQNQPQSNYYPTDSSTSNKISPVVAGINSSIHTCTHPTIGTRTCTRSPSSCDNDDTVNSNPCTDTMENDDSLRSLVQVNSRNTVNEWRADGNISEGASIKLFRKNRRRSSSRQSYSSQQPDNVQNSTTSASLLGQSYISSIAEDLQWAFGEWTNQTLDVATAEDWAIFLHGVLTRESRGYHGLQHVFVLSAGASPMQFLAAVFRDVISHYIDGGESLPNTRQMQLLEGVLDPNTLVLSKDLTDPRDCLVVDIFGHKLGQDLAIHQGLHQGLDVFLSAMLANRLMKEHLALPYLAQLAACLETTIPFRKPNEQGQTPLDLLFLRFVNCNQKYQLGLTESQIIEALQESADLHNRSVGNMVSTDLAEFLDHTWSLLPERHAALRRRTLYTLAEYYQAIHSMVDVTAGLQPTNVYISFRGLPDEMEMNKFRMRLKRNLSISCVYLRARLLCVAVVSAFACLSGGDGPKSFFFGDLPSVDRQITERLGDGLMADRNEEDDTGKHDEVYDILRGYRMSDKGFDNRAAPLAAYLYLEVGEDLIFKALEHAEVPMTKESGLKLLKSLPKDVVRAVGTEFARVTVSRSKRIVSILQEHFGD